MATKKRKTKETKATNKIKRSRLMDIEVRTMPNGYSLEVDKKGYMYFDVPTLVEGILVHVGMERSAYMKQSEIHVMVEGIKDGSVIKTLQAEREEQDQLIESLKFQLQSQRKNIRELKRQI